MSAAIFYICSVKMKFRNVSDDYVLVINDITTMSFLITMRVVLLLESPDKIQQSANVSLKFMTVTSYQQRQRRNGNLFSDT